MPFSPHDVKNTWGEFDGTITKWQGFRDRFVAAIHDNDKIAPAYKFAYLKGSLTGKAARTLGEWQLTESNYVEAWKRMDEMFNRKYATCRELLRQFYKLPWLEGIPRAAELQKMSNVTHETLRQLKAQGVPTEGWDMMIVHVLHEKMDSETACKWEETRSSEQPTVQEICTFLEKRAVALESVQDFRLREPARPSTSVQGRLGLGRMGKITPQTGRNEKRKSPCQACGSLAHPIWECSDFLSLSLRARQDFVRDRALCTNCLKTKHTAKDCFQGPCTRCPGRVMHNSTLCPIKNTKNDGMVLKVQEGWKKRTAVIHEKED